MFRRSKWVGGVDGLLELIDQRRLPGGFVKLRCQTVQELYEAIKTLAVRGAPAIGVLNEVEKRLKNMLVDITEAST